MRNIEIEREDDYCGRGKQALGEDLNSIHFSFFSITTVQSSLINGAYTTMCVLAAIITIQTFSLKKEQKLRKEAFICSTTM